MAVRQRLSPVTAEAAVEGNPAPLPHEARGGDREAVARDRDAIGRLADELVPALMARLTASGLGEVEIREGGWKVRLRKPVGATVLTRPVTDPSAAAAHASSRGARAKSEGREHRAEDADAADQNGDFVAAKSPAVGVYQPRRDLSVGMRIHAGDRLGAVDVLGVPHDVVAPVDGLVGSSLAEAGEAVEYGQELVRIEPPMPVGVEARARSTEPPKGAEF